MEQHYLICHYYERIYIYIYIYEYIPEKEVILGMILFTYKSHTDVIGEKGKDKSLVSK